MTNEPMRTLNKEKQYTEIEFGWGSNVEDAVNQLLQSPNKLLKGTFNGHVLYSDTVTMDSAYLGIVGKTKVELDEDNRKWRENYNKEKEEHKNKIPKLIEEYKVKGRAVLEEAYWELWDKLVPVRLSDLYEGMELDCTLTIIKEFPNFENASIVFANQDHSGMSHSLVAGMVQELSSKGKAFIRYENGEDEPAVLIRGDVEGLTPGEVDNLVSLSKRNKDKFDIVMAKYGAKEETIRKILKDLEK